MNQKRLAVTLVKFFLLLIMSFALISCSSGKGQDQKAASGQKKVKIGIIDHQTGALNRTGTWVMNGEKLAVEEINAKGGINIGGEKYLIEPFYYDSASTADGAVAALQKFITQEKGKIVLGTMATDATAAMMPIAEQNKVVVLSTAAAGPILTSQGWKYYFRGGPYNTAYVNHVNDLVAKKIGAKKVHILVINNPWGVSYGDAYAKSLKDSGVEVTGYDKFNHGQGDFSSFITKIRSANPDLLLLAAENEDAEPFLKQLRTVMPKLVVTESAGTIPEELIKTIPNMAPFISASRGAPSTDKSNEVDKKYKEKFKEDSNSFVWTGYDDVHMMAAVLEKAGTVTDTEKIKQTFLQVDFTGLMGKYTPFKENGDNALGCAMNVVTKDGKVARMWAEDPKLSEIVNAALGK